LATLSLIYDLPEAFRPQDLESLSSAGCRLVKEPVHQYICRYLDTFDWRLHDAGEVLEFFQSSKSIHLIWRRLNSGQILLNQVVHKVPRFSADCQIPGVRQRLEPVIERRALQEKLSVVSEISGLRVVDDNEKTLVRLDVRRDHINLPQSIRQIPLPPKLYVYPYRGYEKELKHILTLLRERLHLVPCTLDPLVSGLQAMGVKAGGYSSHWRYPLLPEQPAPIAVRHILRQLLGIIEANRPGSCQNQDSEFLHDLRRAVIRTRYLTALLRDLLGRTAVNRFEQEFEWLEQVTRPCRDMDRFMELFNSFQARLPQPQQPYLAPFREFLREHKLQEQQQLCTALESPRYQRLLESWEPFLSKEPPAAELVGMGGRPIAALASDLIDNTYQEVLEQGNVITPSTGVDALISMYHNTKGLYFLVEFFRDLFPEKQIQAIFKPLEAMRMNLEDFRDLEVQRQALVVYRDAMLEEQRLTHSSLQAMEQLVRDLALQEQEIRKSFAPSFKKFSTAKAAAAFHALRAEGTTAVEVART